MNNKKRYMLFHCHHLGTLFQFVWLRTVYNYDEKVVLLVNHKFFSSSLFAQNLIKNKIFDRIISIQEPKNFEEKKEETFVCDYYDQFFCDNGLSFSDIKEIYTACDLNNLFPIYCILNDRMISYIEMYEGQFADFTRYSASTKVFGYPSWLEMLERKYNSLSGDGGKYTQKRLLWPGSAIEYSDKDIQVEFLDLFYSLPKDYRTKIIDCCSFTKRIPLGEALVFLLNSPRWTSSMVNIRIQDYYLPYVLIIDYFLSKSKNLIIKKHPHADALDDIDLIFSDRNIIIPNTVPIEFLGLAKNLQIQCLMSVESSGNTKIQRFAKKEIKLGTRILEVYPYFHRLAMAQMIMNSVGMIENVRIDGSISVFFEVISKYSFSLPIDKVGFKMDDVTHSISVVSKQCTALSDVLMKYENFSKNEICIFLDEECFSTFLSEQEVNPYDIKKQVATVFIISDEYKDGSFVSSRIEPIFILCNDRKLLVELRNIELEYKLSYSEKSVRVKGDNIVGAAGNDLYSALGRSVS